MAYSATFAAQQSSIRAQSTANQGIRRSSKRRASVPRAQKPQQSEEAGAVVFTTDSLSNSVGAAVIEKPETKTPSPSINVIPVSRCVGAPSTRIYSGISRHVAVARPAMRACSSQTPHPGRHTLPPAHAGGQRAFPLPWEVTTW